MVSSDRPGFVCLRFPLIVLFLMAVSVGLFGSTANAFAPGRTPGAFAVSRVGTATYTIPIWAPPGPQGLQPKIALTYNSGHGNGYVGVGWSLSGLSSIYRCMLRPPLCRA